MNNPIDSFVIPDYCCMTTYAKGSLAMFGGNKFKAKEDGIINTAPGEYMRIPVSVNIERGLFARVVTKEYEIKQAWEEV